MNPAPLPDFLSATEDAANNTSVKQKHDFWHDPTIEAIRWNQVFPYQFIVVKATENGYVQNKKWNFTLPFPPSSLSMSSPPAITGVVTQGGYHESHGGTPVINISLSGSLGILPARGTAESRQPQSFGQAILAGSIEQAKRTSVSAQGFASNFTGTNSSFKQNLVQDSDFEGSLPSWVARTSGYYQALLLRRFLKNYSIFMTKKENKDYRLAFCIWKQNAVYLVTPGAFSLSQSADSPYEFTYTMSLRAYRQIALSTAGPSAANLYTPSVRQPNGLARILKGILDARDVLENAMDVLGAFVGDVRNSVFVPLRETGLFVKDLLGVPATFADLPDHIKQDAKDAVVTYIAIQESTGKSAKNQDQTTREIHEKFRVLAGSVDGTKINKFTQGVNADEAFDVFKRPENYHDFWNGLKPGAMNLPPVVSDSIITERERVRLYTRQDFQNIRDAVRKVADDFADAIGAGNDVYNDVYQRSSVVSTKTPTQTDYKVLFALNRAVGQLNKLAATSATDAIQYDTMDYLAGLARRSGLVFESPRSKFLVPFPYGMSLERLATLYLGNPDRWIEIAALNGLRAPYVDETGFQLALLTSGSGNEVTVSSIENLYLGQTVWLLATDTNRSKRKITRIVSHSNDLHTITVDGEADCERFTVAGEAILQAYLPDTVNSQMAIYIPSPEDPATTAYVGREIPGVSEYDTLLSSGGVDFLLDDNLDLIVTSDGSTRLAVGLQNLTQHIRILLSLVKGGLIRHPSLGLTIEVGTTIAETSAKELAKNLREMFSDDPAIEAISSVSVLIAGGSAKLAMSVKAYGASQLIPISVDLR
jgi:hypothetical protein